MDTLACDSIQEHRQRSHECFTFTGSHLGDLSLMQDNTTDKLDIVMNHVPGNLVTACHPVILPQRLVTLDGNEVMRNAELSVEIRRCYFYHRILSESSGSRLHDRKCLRENLIQKFLDLRILILHKFVRLRSQAFLLAYRYIFFKFFLDFSNAFLERSLAIPQFFLQLLRLGPKFIIRKFVDRLIGSKYLIQNRFYLLHIPVGLSSEHLFYYVY